MACVVLLFYFFTLLLPTVAGEISLQFFLENPQNGACVCLIYKFLFFPFA